MDERTRAPVVQRILDQVAQREALSIGSDGELQVVTCLRNLKLHAPSLRQRTKLAHHIIDDEAQRDAMPGACSHAAFLPGEIQHLSYQPPRLVDRVAICVSA